MAQTADYARYGLDAHTWVALCSLVLNGPQAKQTTPGPVSFDSLLEKGYASTVLINNQTMLGATQEGAKLFCQCLRVDTVQEGIAHLQAMSLLYQIDHQSR